MITFIRGDIFDSNAKCIVNTVNCEGYMGKGMAYQFKLRFPENNKEYIKACKNGSLRIGTIHCFKENNRVIVNFPTKIKWRDKSELIFIEKGLNCLAEYIKQDSITSIAIPPLGCGNGGLVWDEVKDLIINRLSPLCNDCEIIIYEPTNKKNDGNKSISKLGAESLALLQIKMHLVDWGVQRMQKACFFTNFFGGESYFSFSNSNYNPYSREVEVEARKIKEYQEYHDIHDAAETYKQVYGVITSNNIDKKIHQMMPAIVKATDYVNKIKNNVRLENVATVLFIIQQNPNIEEKLIKELYEEGLGDKSNIISESDITDSIQYLEDTGLIIKNLFGVYELN